ncbi:hypothetical protein KKF34_00700 [Myxococcota bacterium]|nr:hypothetical protein [Myxococcota bacterium]MBU1382914.1 hypothetical protein [Myxococcota bacterium]MBU1495380.1 hypothetical protein [Myxococcota bacterium]
MKFLLVALSVLLLTSCGFSGGILRDSITQVKVDKANFRVVKYGVTTSKTITSVLCAIPAGSSQPFSDMMEDLHKKAGLKKNQMFINFRQDYALKAFLVFFCISTHTLSADIIQFYPDKKSSSVVVDNTESKPEPTERVRKPEPSGSDNESAPVEKKSRKNVEANPF